MAFLINKYGRYEMIGSDSLWEMANVKVFELQDNRPD